MTTQQLGKGVWHDADGTGYIGLDLTDAISTQQEQIIGGNKLCPKDEYHCSLVDVRGYIGDDNLAKEKFIANAVNDYLRKHDLRFVQLGEERYLCRKGDRATLVGPVRIDGFEEFVGFIQTLIPDYRRPFLHVTLLKSETTQYGISINSEDDLLSYCEKLTTQSR